MAERRLVFAHDVKELLNGLESLPWEEEVDYLVDALPTPADVEVVVHGRWLPQVLLGQRVVDCSECKTLGSPHWKRCPVCEAKMEVNDGQV